MGKPWTPMDLATMRALYPQLGAEELSRRLGRTVDAVHKKAETLRLRRETGNPQTMAKVAEFMELAARPDGAHAYDLKLSDARQYAHISRLLAEGKIFKVKVSHKDVRFFASEKGAREFEEALAPRTVAAPVTIRARSRWSADEPAYYPKKPDGTPAYKVTICPSPPATVYRTNTHSVMG